MAQPHAHTVAHPAGAENLCHQAVFMNHAPGTVTPLNPEMVQVGVAVGQRAQWRSLLEGSVRPVSVVEVLVLPQHQHQVPLVPDQGSVQSSRRQLPIHRSMTEFIRGA